jgi:hypothetical protein
MNDQVNRAEATASTEAQNTDAASVVPTSESVDGGSGSTHGSFSVINYDNTMLLDLHADSLYLPDSIEAVDVVKLCERFAMRQFQDLVHDCMLKAYTAGELSNDDGHAVLRVVRVPP